MGNVIEGEWKFYTNFIMMYCLTCVNVEKIVRQLCKYVWPMTNGYGSILNGYQKIITSPSL